MSKWFTGFHTFSGDARAAASLIQASVVVNKLFTWTAWALFSFSGTVVKSRHRENPLYVVGVTPEMRSNQGVQTVYHPPALVEIPVGRIALHQIGNYNGPFVSRQAAYLLHHLALSLWSRRWSQQLLSLSGYTTNA